MNESTLTIEEVETRIRPVLAAADPQMWKFVVTAFQQCVLGKVFPPEAPLEHNWISPGGWYRGQWIWDTMFVADLLALLPDTRDTLRGVFQNYWDFQRRWNAVSPDYAHDMIACMMQPGDANWPRFPAFTQIPIPAWGLERVFRRNGDLELVRAALDPIERYHRWYWRERDVTDIGLAAVGAYSGETQHARFETFDFECNLDDLRLTPHPRRRGAGEGAWYGNVCVPGITAYLIHDELCLARLAEAAGDAEAAKRCRARADKGIAAMQRHMWSEAAGTYLAVDRDTLAQIPIPTVGSWIPLHAGIPTAAQAARMAAVLASPEWNTPLPVPTVGRTDPRWSDGKFDNPGGNFWRGDVWPATNYQIADGLARYGHRDLAVNIAERTIRNAMRQGISEHYDCDTGRPLGVAFLGMSATMVTMALDGLAPALAVSARPAG